MTEHDWLLLIGGVIIGLGALPLWISIVHYQEVKRDVAEARRIRNARTDD